MMERPDASAAKKRADFAILFAFAYFLCEAAIASVLNIGFTGALNVRNVVYRIAYALLFQAFLARLYLARAWPLWLIAVIHALRLAWNASSLLYFEHFAGFITIDIIRDYLREGFTAIKSYQWSASVALRLSLLFIDAPLLVLMMSGWKGIKERFRSHTGGRARVAKGIAVFLLIAGFFSTEAYNFAHRVSLYHLIRYGDPYEYSTVLKYGTEWNFAASLLHGMIDDGSVADPYAGLEELRGTATGRPRSMVFIQVESLDAFMPSMRFRGESVMPFLAAAWSRGAGTEKLVCNMGAGTLNCELGVLNSIVLSKPLPKGHEFPNSLPKTLAASGYRSFAFHGDEGTFYARKRIYERMGFEEFYDIDDMGLNHVVWGAKDGDVFEFVVTKASSIESPFLFYVITMSSHNPFNLLEEDDVATWKYETGDELADAYFKSMSYVDRCIEEFCRSMLEIDPSVIFCVYGDHPAFIDGPSYRSSQFMYRDRLVRFVPLLIFGGDVGLGAKNAEFGAASFVDIAPTVLALSGTDYVFKAGGENLFGNSPSGLIRYQDLLFERREIGDAISREFPRIEGEP